MTWFVNAFSVMERAAGTGLKFASTVVKPVLNAFIAVSPGIASAARYLSVIPTVGLAAAAVAQTATLVEVAAKTGRDIIRVAEEFGARTRPADPPVSVPIFTAPNAVPAPVSVQVTRTLPTPEELFGIVPQQSTSSTVSPAPIQGGVVNGRTILPMPVRRGGVSIDRKYERDLKQILGLLDADDDGGVDELTKGFSNVHIGVPRSVKTGRNMP